MNNIVSIKEFLKTEKETFTIEMSTFIKASAETIYSILTNKTSLEEFMGCVIEGDLTPGSQIKFTWAEYDGQDPNCSGINGGEIVNMIPSSLLSFTWGDENPARGLPWGSTLVEFKIAVQQGGCLVTIIHYDLPSEKEAKDHQGGWTEFLEQNTSNWA